MEFREWYMLKKMFLIIPVILLITGVLMSGCSTRVAKDGDIVDIHYTGMLEDGSEFDSSEGKDPLQFTLGAGQMIPGFENAVRGMKVGETKTVTIPAAEAYGPHDDELVMEINRDELPEDLEPEVGLQIGVTYKGGQQGSATITEVTETTVTLDANHFLAGKDLTFKIKLVKIRR